MPRTARLASFTQMEATEATRAQTEVNGDGQATTVDVIRSRDRQRGRLQASGYEEESLGPEVFLLTSIGHSASGPVTATGEKYVIGFA